MKSFLLLFMLVLLGGAQASAQSFEPYSFTARDLFPSALISTATVDWNGEEETAEDQKTDDDPDLEEGEIAVYGDENGWIGVSLYEVEADSEVRVEISIDGFLNASVWEGALYDDYEESQPNYELISVSEARAIGIMPIASGREKR